MKRKIIIMLGAIYVSIAITVATFYQSTEVDCNSVITGQTCKMVEENQRSNRHSERLPGPTRVPKIPEYVDGRPVKYQMPPAKKMVTKKAEVNYPANYLLIWTAKWCPKCSQMEVIGNKLKAEGFDVFYIDFDKNRKKAREDKIAALPTAIIYTDKEEIRRVIGVSPQNKMQVEARIRKFLKKNGEKPGDYELH